MKVEIFSDVACPFCFIGKRHFEGALAAFPHADEVEVTWRSFQLDPGAPTEPHGDNYGRLAAKYGVSIEEAKAMSGRVGTMAEAAGLSIDFDNIVSVNTFDAHRAAHLARDEGREGPMIEQLFSAYFIRGENVADQQVLVRLAGEAGIDRDLAASVLDSDRFADEVRTELGQARSLGLSGVPAFVIDRSLLVSGAQPPEVILGALQQARDGEGENQPSAGAPSSEA